MKMKYAMAFLTGMLVSAAPLAVHAEDTAAKEQALSCPKCQKTWVTRPHHTGKVTTYRTEQSMECEDCTSAVANFFKTGKFEHTCKTCGEINVCATKHADAKPVGDAPAAEQKDASVACPKCQAVWVRNALNGGRGTTYHSEKKVVCSSCQDMAMDMMKTGKTAGKCPKCDDELTACKM